MSESNKVWSQTISGRSDEWLGGSPVGATKKWSRRSQSPPKSPSSPSIHIEIDRAEAWIGGSGEFYVSPERRPKQLDIGVKRGSIKENPFLKNDRLNLPF